MTKDLRKAEHPCCDRMSEVVSFECPDHPHPYDCPDALITYGPRFDEYGLIVHDGGLSFVTIMFCPWCGKQLPCSKRDRWFEELEKLGFDDPWDQEIPAEFETDKWWINAQRTE